MCWKVNIEFYCSNELLHGYRRVVASGEFLNPKEQLVRHALYELCPERHGKYPNETGEQYLNAAKACTLGQGDASRKFNKAYEFYEFCNSCHRSWAADPGNPNNGLGDKKHDPSATRSRIKKNYERRIEHRRSMLHQRMCTPGNSEKIWSLQEYLRQSISSVSLRNIYLWDDHGALLLKLRQAALDDSQRKERLVTIARLSIEILKQQEAEERKEEAAKEKAQNPSLGALSELQLGDISIPAQRVNVKKDPTPYPYALANPP
ncbi:hypothetical protein BKA67DRAFT_681314 [Truncatella angustata]|uniref:Uncharacterized protein n=1 Tax=Truncatella angustata TaxID=152316 RepID=A0A9P8ZT15_9PEZI|nr:uncharacterized protein BKA67DRAFT_681314 [Truncatella angustata]KAH6648307.1 hypothetical protein BKA67DRAFT_681314 [Truncatella angustata]KAH8201667.1 hypothetical protein TruAng_004188 [Truncatella angustata]